MSDPANADSGDEGAEDGPTLSDDVEEYEDVHGIIQTRARAEPLNAEEVHRNAAEQMSTRMMDGRRVRGGARFWDKVAELVSGCI